MTSGPENQNLHAPLWRYLLLKGMGGQTVEPASYSPEDGVADFAGSGISKPLHDHTGFSISTSSISTLSNPEVTKTATASSTE